MKLPGIVVNAFRYLTEHREVLRFQVELLVRTSEVEAALPQFA
jgi:hypothetical protein